MTRASHSISVFLALFTSLLFCNSTSAVDFADVQKRMDRDSRDNKSIIVRVFVALADNRHQGIVPVPAKLGDGQNPNTNLYWGARYGLRTYMTRDAGWSLVARQLKVNARVLERLVLKHELLRKGKKVPVFLVADAYDGQFMEQALRDFHASAAGLENLTVNLHHPKLVIDASQPPHLIVFVGHNGLMDFSVSKLFPASTLPKSATPYVSKATIVLACKSRQYFRDNLIDLATSPMLMTNNLMAPEAYTLDSAIKAWISVGSPHAVHEAAAESYSRFQRVPKPAAKRLFHVQ